MNSSETIRARIELPCSIRLSGSDLRIARGVTEELARETLIVIASPVADNRWLKGATNVFIAVELPSAGTFEPRILECAATISRVRAFSSGVRIVADVHRMAILNRDSDTRTKGRSVAQMRTADPVPAAGRPQNDQPVILVNHATNSNLNLTGENTMSFVKNFFIEEEGQDMVEYGLILALVVAVGLVVYQTLGTQITAALGATVTTITGAL